jgi:PleD family two-component response regulator
MTFGVAVHAGGAPIDECVRRADEALYYGKSQGKNQVVLSDPAQPSLRLASS